MNRPQPRQSTLAHMTPLAPTSPPTSASSAGNTRTPNKTATETTKITVNIPAESAGRARAAYWATGHLTGTRSFSQWVTDAINDKLSRDEKLHNNGQPFKPLQPGTIPTGRPSALGVD